MKYALFFLFGVLFVSTATAQEELSAQEWFNKGKLHQTAGEEELFKIMLGKSKSLTCDLKQCPSFAIAIYAFNTAIELYKNDNNHTEPHRSEVNYELGDVHNSRGEVYSWLGDYKQAIVDYSKAIKLQPENQEFWCNRGSAYKEIGNFQQAIQDSEKAIQLEIQNTGYYYVDALSLQAYAYEKLGFFRQAITDYDMLIKNSPEDYGLYFRRGNAYYHLQNYEDAKKDWRYAAKHGNKQASDSLAKVGGLSFWGKVNPW